jgi:hypothetical protein
LGHATRGALCTIARLYAELPFFRRYAQSVFIIPKEESSLSNQVQNDAATPSRSTMLEQIYALPGSQGASAIANRNTHVGLREGGANMGRHIVPTLSRVSIQALIFRNNAVKEIIQITQHVEISVLLNEQ